MSSIEREQIELRHNYDTIDALELVSALWASKWLVAAAVAVSTCLAAAIALSMSDVYRTEALIAPTSKDYGGPMSALAAEYGGLASLAGFDLGEAEVDSVTLGLKTLESRKFIADFIDRRQILVPLVAARGWNRSTGDLVVDQDLYDVDTGQWVREVSPPRSTEPSDQEAYEAFAERLSVNRDRDTGLITVAFEYYSPNLAKAWVDWLIEDINRSFMEKDVDEAEQAIEFLKDQISATSLTELQSVLFRLIEEQMKTIMLAEISNEYLFKTIDPSVVPEEKSNPGTLLVTLTGIAMGLAVGVMLALIRYFLFVRRVAN